MPIMPVGLQLIGYAQITNGGVPAYATQGGVPICSGIFNPGVAPVDNGAGDFTLTTVSGIQMNQFIFEVVPLGLLAASQLKSGTGTPATATTVRFTTLQEGAAGAVSALTDYDCAVRAWSLNPLGGS